MLQVAVYGKGGIGKSTTSSNLSFTLAKKGVKVLQIGCDPKHDSTKYLIEGKEQTTVLDYIRSTPPSERKLEDIMLTGAGGVMCIEAGGPEPGIGCAGRGILTTFDTIERMGISEIEKDITLYDGTIYAVGTPKEVITEENLKVVYQVETSIVDDDGAPHVILKDAIPMEEA